MSEVPLWEEFRESGRCSRDTYQESYITEYTSIRRKGLRFRRAVVIVGGGAEFREEREVQTTTP